MVQSLGPFGYLMQQARENTVTGDRLWWGTTGNYAIGGAPEVTAAYLIGTNAIEAFSQPTVAFQKSRITYLADISDNTLLANINGATGQSHATNPGTGNFATVDRQNYIFHGIYGNAINLPWTGYMTGMLIRQGILTGSDLAIMENWLDTTIN